MEKLCTNCGTLGLAVKRNKGSLGVEALLLILSVLMAAINLVFGGLVFLIFVVYCIWRLSSKHSVCPKCESANVIPATSPIARNYISQIYKRANE